MGTSFLFFFAIQSSTYRALDSLSSL